MNLLDTRTVLFGYIISNAICAAVMTSLWLQNRRHSPGLGFWLADFILQFAAVLLIALRGPVPEVVSILLGSPLVIGGTLLLYLGLERYTGQPGSQLHNYLLLAVFISIHAYFTFVQPSLSARNISFSLALLAICSQCAWLLLGRVPLEMRPHTKPVGLIFGAYSLVSLVRIFVDWAEPQGNDLFKSGLFDTLVILVFQMLFIGLTFGLSLMVNRRLIEDIRRLASFPESNPNPVLAIGPGGAITFSNPAVTTALHRIGAPADARAFIPADMDDILEELARGEPAKFYREVTLGGSIFAEDLYLLPQFATAHVYVHDITERKQTEAALKKSEEKFSKAFENSPDAVTITSMTDGKIIQANEGFFRLTELTPEEIVGKTTLELNLWERLADRDKFLAALQRSGRVLDFEATFRKKTGELVRGWISGEALQLPEGQCVLTVIHNVTELRLAEERLNQTLERLELATRAGGLGIWDWDIRTNRTVWNDRMYELYGIKPGDFAGTNEAWLASIHPDDRAALDEILWQAQRGEQGYDTEFRVVWPDGTVRVLAAIGQFVRDTAGQPLRMTGVNYDITERKQAEKVLAQEQSLMEALMDNMPNRIYFKDRASRFIRISRSQARMFDLSDPAQAAGKTDFDFFTEEHARVAYQDEQEIIRTGQPLIKEEKETWANCPDTWVSTVKLPLHDKGGNTLGTFGISMDITERKQAETIIQARLRLVEFAAHYSLEDLLQKTLDEVCALTDSPIGFYHFVDPDQETLSLQAWSTRTLKEFCTAAGKGLHYSVDEAGVWADCIRQRRPVIHNDYASLPHRKGLPEGHSPLTRELVVPILREDRVVAILGIGNRARAYLEKDIDLVTHFADVAWEITRRKRAEEALQTYSEELEERVQARTRELRDAQAQLVRREKLAVLGQMSGGIAHELRQPLAVISNAVYYLQAAQPEPDPTFKEYLGLIAAELHTADHIITDLLSFARARAAERELITLAALVEPALARNPAPAAIAVQASLASNPPLVYVDPRQLGQVLNNLITNAYQAMPRGGQLTLTAAPAAPGFVSLAVADTGEGIAPENLPKLFEPLFTTKPQGIGLGLTITKMLVEANGGTIEVTSEADRGTTFQLTLPVKGEGA